MNTKYEGIKKIELVKSDEAVNALLKAGWVLLDIINSKTTPVAFVMGLKDNAVSSDREPTDAEVLKVCKQLFIELGLKKLWRVIERNLNQAHNPPFKAVGISQN